MRQLPAPTVNDGFRVTPAENGGYILTINDPRKDGLYAQPEAAFTGALDMIAWLARELSVTVTVSQ
ncbi:hypothetical protein NKH91_06005 [Mesorhizobium sp. M0894]|uniref:hypothetical protein n=1 Tax=unclassified Mesorhizobium TaxID=325217 RepID=UPI0033369FBD